MNNLKHHAAYWFTWTLLIAAALGLTFSADAAQQRTQFDHLTTGFELLGQHRDLPCESCHTNAIFKGTPRDCAACHGAGTTIRATRKSSVHIRATDRCDTCHTPVAWQPAVNFDHTQALGSCSSCHDNTHAQGKGPQHIDTNLECDACHSTIGWAGAVFSHDGLTSGCARCHDNVQATGMPATHIPVGVAASQAACEACHSTSTFVTWHDVTSTAAVHSAVVGTVACETCHETANYLGMTPSTATAAGDSRPPAALDKNHPTQAQAPACGDCHDTSSFTATAAIRPANHIPTNAPCIQCHTTPGQNAVFSVTGVHQGATQCLSCHGPTVANTFANIQITTTPSDHIPIGALDCNGSGCHTAANVNPGGFSLGAANINQPTLNGAGHTTVAAAVSTCSTCHQAASYRGMVASTNSTAGDSRPSTTLDSVHPTSGDCGGCHTTAPTFATDVGSSGKPANHIPTSAPCAQCHTTAGNYTVYSVTGTHQGVTTCVTCHGSTVANTFIGVTVTTTPNNHIPIGTLDCNGSGCHTTGNLSTGGFNIGSASPSNPTLTVAGHTTVAPAVASCQTCHQTAAYLGMVASTNTTAGDSRPSTTLDSLHPAAGDCSGCHTTMPTFGTDVTSSGKPANHIPTNAPCSQCHTTAGNYTVYSVTGTHQGVTGCTSCHGPNVANTFLNVTITTTPNNHIPIGNLDCNGSGCHTATNVNSGGFNIGTANINTPTLTVAGHTTVAAAVAACATCHEAAAYLGMIASTNTTAGDSRPNSTLDASHPATGDCGGCHLTTPTFGSAVQAKPANHIPTTAPCAQCHLSSNLATYSVTGVHQGVTTCVNCHGSTVANTFANVTITTTPNNHIPIGALDCNGSGCHTTTNVNAGGFNIGSANISSPTLTVAGHTTVAAAVATCSNCHETAPYLGMIASTSTTAGDSRPTAFDKAHPTSGDCGGCHTTTPTFSSDQTAGAKPANHIPTTAACTQCHTTTGNYAAYSSPGTHIGVTGCLTCHAPSVANTFANISITTTPSNHFPFGSLDCNGSGCHSTTNVSSGGFNIGSANISSPTLTVAGHTTIAAAVATCSSCHETAPYLGMVASSNTAAGDSRPNGTLDAAHPTSGDCGGCHTTTPTFSSDQTGSSVKPANHIPTTAACAQCHTTAGNYAAYSVTGTHQGVTGCLTCHAPSVATTFANVTIVTTPSNHIPIGSLDCNGSGCHTTNNVNPGGFSLGTANINTPTLNTAGHTTVATAVTSCQTCHQSASYLGMVASTNTSAGDSRPNATLDGSHPTSGDCGGCHTSTPTFAGNITNGAKPSNHIPTNAPCAQCHTTPGNYAAYVMGATGHTGITSNCSQCHGAGLSFANMAPPTLKEPPTGPPAHIPVQTKADCIPCHTATNFTTFAGVTMTHAPVTGQACDSCHEYQMSWYGITGLWTRPSPNHHAGQDCGGSGCHSIPSRYKRSVRPTAPATATRTPARVQAGGVSSAIAATTVRPATAVAPATTAKPSNHIPTSNACSSCHISAAWLPVARVDHTQVKGTCASCHNGVIALGKRSSHVATTASCDSCHTTNAWTPARFDHAAVAPHTCITCHDSVHAVGKPRNHIPTSQQCDACHNSLAWMPVRLDHSTLTTACATCHNNAGAVGKPAGHMVTQRDCATCHTYPDWAVITFKHTAAAYPGSHRTALSCTACHTSNTDQVPYPSPANAGTCAACHAKDFKPDSHPKTVKGMLYTVSELANCSGACHVYSDSTRSTITRSLPGPYHRVTDATFKR